ncbi:MAG: hypothetical protein FWG64_01670 [Firmicutes bacterium]|nr:hypothetical protein [Bacillota bacterium]
MKKSTLDHFNNHLLANIQGSENENFKTPIACVSCKFYNEKITATFGYATPTAICNNPEKCDENFDNCDLYVAKNGG